MPDQHSHSVDSIQLLEDVGAHKARPVNGLVKVEWKAVSAF
jgi:hypothetical protein